MRICVVGPSYPLRGGISHYTSLLSSALEAGHEVKLISFKRLYPGLLFPGKTQVDDSVCPIGGSCEPLLDSMNPLSWQSASRSIRKFNPDIVLIQWWHPFFAPPYAHIASHCPESAKIIFLCHNVIPHESGNTITRMSRTLLSRSALRHGHAFIVHSEEDMVNLRAIFPNANIAKSPHPTYSVFNSGNWDRDECRRQLKLQGHVILFFGLVRRYKGLSTLIEAMPKVIAELEDATLLVVGEFYDDKLPYLNRINELCIEDRVRVVDQYVPNEEVGRYFMASDVVALPYVSATQSGIVQIAFGFSKPVIATAVGGLPEVVADGETGFLVPPEDPDALAGRILEYFQQSRGEQFAENIRGRMDDFSWNKMVRVIEGLAGGSL